MANNPAGEISLNLGITGPHYTIGAACAAGNAGMIQGAQMLRLGECDVALAGGVSESIHTFGIFASFKSQGALATHDDPTKASRPFDAGAQRHRGGRRGLHVRARAAGRRPGPRGQDLRRARRLRHEQRRQRFRAAQSRAAGRVRRMRRCAGPASRPDQIDIVSTHATGTGSGDTQECAALRQVFAGSSRTRFNNAKSFIGHAMGAAGALELAGNLPAFDDGVCHPTINVDGSIRSAAWTGLVVNQPREDGPRRLHFEQLVRHAGHQFGGDESIQTAI